LPYPFRGRQAVPLRAESPEKGVSGANLESLAESSARTIPASSHGIGRLSFWGSGWPASNRGGRFRDQTWNLQRNQAYTHDNVMPPNCLGSVLGCRMTQRTIGLLFGAQRKRSWPSEGAENGGSWGRNDFGGQGVLSKVPRKRGMKTCESWPARQAGGFARLPRRRQAPRPPGFIAVVPELVRVNR